MISAAVLEWLGDNAFVWITVFGTVAFIGFLWANYRKKVKSR